ncbi:MAG: hypothetical protein L6427_07030, partial [Actinomycetia bacterium]|nr:hypothetical protein [Actinomycetes bacterium]
MLGGVGAGSDSGVVVATGSSSASVADSSTFFSSFVGWEPARRNLITYARVVTALKLEPVYQERAKRHQQESGGAVPSKLTEPPI